MNPARLQAQEATQWYMAHLDPYQSNPDNLRNHLRGPLVAVTVKALNEDEAAYLPKPLETTEPTPQKTTSSSTNGGGDWRQYLTPSDATAATTTTSSSTNDKNTTGQEAYDALPRRTKARVEAFLAGCMLAVPSELSAWAQEDEYGRRSTNSSRRQKERQEQEFVSLQEGLSGFGLSKLGKQDREATLASNNQNNGDDDNEDPKSHRRISSSILKRSSVTQPQMDKDDLMVRLELHIRTMQRIKTLGDDCVIAMEPPKSIKARARYLTQAFVATAGCLRSMGPLLTRLLNCFTMEVLAVETLSEELTKVMRRIASEYEHGTSFASLAFLSTPEVNADSLLTPLIVKYLKYLQSDWEHLVKDCELERMLTQCLDGTMRKLFKTIEFRSIGHLLEICHENRHKLQHIELAPNVCAIAENIHSLAQSKDAIRQALRDLQREVITVNGHILPPVTSRKELLHLMAQTLNARTLTAANSTSRGTSSHGVSSSAPPTAPSSPRRQSKNGKTATTNGSTGKKSHGGEDTDASSTLFSSDVESSSGMSEAVDSSEGEKTSSKKTNKKKSSSRRNFHLSTIDLLTRRLLIAASRTGNGGDAYFVVRDLFGGEDVEVIPTSTLPLQGRIVRPGTIDILVRLASVTIKCHQSFDVYPRELVGDCEPLIQFHTTTTETISLQEVRSTDKGDGSSEQVTREGEEEQPEQTQAVLVVKEQMTNFSGFRTIAVRPALYDKVEVWNTPS